MKFQLFSFLIFSLVGILVSRPDYYWRDYDGAIPDDAFVGYSSGDLNTYIGNIGTNGGGLYVGKIVGGESNISVYAADNGPNAGIATRDTNIKILCTRHPENFEWIFVDYYTVDDMPFNSVVGGYSSGGAHHLYIARLNVTDGEGVGNLYVYDRSTFGYNVMYYLNSLFGHTVLNRFNVLVYNEPLKSDTQFDNVQAKN